MSVYRFEMPWGGDNFYFFFFKQKTAYEMVAVDNELRAYFSKHQPAGLIEQAIQSYSSRVVNRAYSGSFHAIELKIGKAPRRAQLSFALVARRLSLHLRSAQSLESLPINST